MPLNSDEDKILYHFNPGNRIRKRRFKKLLNLGLQRPLILNDRWAEKIEVHVGRLEAGSISDLQFPSAGIC